MAAARCSWPFWEVSVRGPHEDLLISSSTGEAFLALHLQSVQWQMSTSLFQIWRGIRNLSLKASC